jgi:hypothetical protein
MRLLWMQVDRMTTVALAATGAVMVTALSPVPVAACSVFDGRACAPTICSVFDRDPCIPAIEFPIGQGLRWTVKSAAIDHRPARTIVGDVVAAPPRKLDTLRAMFDALGGCWIPPAKGEAWAGMEMSVRFAFKRSGEMIAAPAMTYASRNPPAGAREIYFDTIRAALARCTPLPFTAGMGEAIAGRPIAIRFIENRVLRQISEQP